MCANLVGIIISLIGLLVIVIGIGIYSKRIYQQKQQFIILTGSLLGVMILLLTLLFILRK